MLLDRPQRLRPVALWDCQRSSVDGAQTGPPCMSDTTDFKKGGIHICSCLMCACWRVFLCVHVLICMYVSDMHGARADSVLAGNTCF